MRVAVCPEVVNGEGRADSINYIFKYSDEYGQDPKARNTYQRTIGEYDFDS